jgi:uncharacterized damage-inducible protein DinB
MAALGGVPESVRVRLAAQAEALVALARGVSPAELDARPAPEEWSARENLAHLARHQAAFLERLERVVREDAPRLGRYRAEEDGEWPAWQALPIAEVVRRHQDGRRRLAAWVTGLAGPQAARIGVHPTFGPMSVVAWLEFFLLHEAHHLYVTMVRLGEARRRRAPAGTQG